jgi:hypothetical protein
MAGLRCRCPSCSAAIRVPDASAPVSGNPWTPTQLFAASYVFGSLAAGAALGVNLARLGKRGLLLPCLLAGGLLFLVEAWLAVTVLPHLISGSDGGRLVMLLERLVVSGVFLLLLKPSFDVWKRANWIPSTTGQRYKPGNLGQFFLIVLACAAVEVIVILLLVAVC